MEVTVNVYFVSELGICSSLKVLIDYHMFSAGGIICVFSSAVLWPLHLVNLSIAPCTLGGASPAVTVLVDRA